MDELIRGDMPGDSIKIGECHRKIVEGILPYARRAFNESGRERFVISIFGGSGAGKSEVGSLLASDFVERGIPSYLLSGDNYPYRIPMDNDRERLARYRYGGLRRLSGHPDLCMGWMASLKQLWVDGGDADPEMLGDYPFLKEYQLGGATALRKYLGTDEEIDFGLIGEIIDRFKGGDNLIPLKRMGRSQGELFFEPVDFSETRLLIVEWTHGNHTALRGVDFSAFIFSSSRETLEHRRERNRDSGVDSAFTSLVLAIEQERLNAQADSASLIVSRAGEIITYQELQKRVHGEN